MEEPDTAQTGIPSEAQVIIPVNGAAAMNGLCYLTSTTFAEACCPALRSLMK